MEPDISNKSQSAEWYTKNINSLVEEVFIVLLFRFSVLNNRVFERIRPPPTQSLLGSRGDLLKKQQQKPNVQQQKISRATRQEKHGQKFVPSEEGCCLQSVLDRLFECQKGDPCGTPETD